MPNAMRWYVSFAGQRGFVVLIEILKKLLNGAKTKHNQNDKDITVSNVVNNLMI
jgi:hypothetical protein